MQFFGIFSVLFGTLVLIYPDLISILIGSFFLIVGFNILAASWIFRNGSTPNKSWKFGSYEITRRK